MGFQGWSPPGFPAGCCQERHRTCGTWWDAARCSPQPFPARGPGVRMLLARLERPKLVCCRWRSCHLELFPPGGQTPPFPQPPFPSRQGSWHGCRSSWPLPVLQMAQFLLQPACPRAVVLRGCFWGGFQHPTRVQERWRCAGGTGTASCGRHVRQPGVSSALGGVARGADVLLTHHLSLSSRPC